MKNQSTHGHLFHCSISIVRLFEDWGSYKRAKIKGVRSNGFRLDIIRYLRPTTTKGPRVTCRAEKRNHCINRLVFNLEFNQHERLITQLFPHEYGHLQQKNTAIRKEIPYMEHLNTGARSKDLQIQTITILDPKRVVLTLLTNPSKAPSFGPNKNQWRKNHHQLPSPKEDPDSGRWWPC